MSSRLLRRNHYSHSPARHPAGLINFRQIAHRLGNLVKKLVTLVPMGHLSAAENKRELHLVAFFDKLAGVFDLYINIVRVGFGAKANLLKRAGVMGFLTRIPGLSLLLVEPFAVIHYPADGRFAGRGNLDQVQSRLARLVEGEIPVNNTNLIVRFINEPNLIDPYPPIYPQTLNFDYHAL